MRIEIDERAWSDVFDVARSYDLASSGLGDRFLDAFGDLIERIEQKPLAYAISHPQLPLRACLFKRFPYVAYFAMVADTPLILAVIHGSRAADQTLRRRFLGD